MAATHDVGSPMMMALWRRPRWIVMALLAMFSLAAPSLAWACPATGIVGTPAQVCALVPAVRSASHASMASMPCCASAQATKCLSVCCKPVPQLPSQDNSKSLQAEPSHAAGAAIVSHLTRVAATLVVLSVLPPAPLQCEPPLGRSSFEDASPIPLTAQHAPEAQAGRAPPSL